MAKYYLMAPGPSMIPEKVLQEMALPIIHHRTKQFETILEAVRGKLKKVFQTRNEVVLLSAVGSGAMEASIVNFFSLNDKVLVVRSGKFGERWSDQSKIFGLNVIDLDVPWGAAVNPEDIKKILEQNPDIKGVMCQACETSTGTQHPIEAIAKIVRNYKDVLFLVDGITAVGVTDLRPDEWGIDVLISGSQKAFMLPPGLSFVVISERAMKAMATSNIPKYYFNLAEEVKQLQKNQTHFTPAISLIRGLNVALDIILEEGLPAVFKRHKALAQSTRDGVKALGLELFSKSPADGVTAVCAPQGLDGEKIVNHLRDKYNISIIGGQDAIKGKVFRIGHMGYCSQSDVDVTLKALGQTLKDLAP